MEARRCEEVGEPCVRTDVNARVFSFPGDLSRLRESAAARQIGLGYIDAATLNQIAEAPGGSFLLTCREPGLYAGGFDFRIAVVAFGVEKIFEPENVVRFKGAAQFDRILRATI